MDCDEMKNKRIYWIDVIKAICIFSVLYNHQLFSQNWIRIDYFFLVGFFFCSGVTFNIDKGILYRLVRIIDSLVIPYILLSSLMFFLFATNLSALLKGDFSLVVDWWKNILLGHYAWFVPCLVCVECLYSLSAKAKVEGLVCWGGVIIFLLGLINGLSFPWHIDTAMYAFLFFHIGFILKPYLIRRSYDVIIKKNIIIILLLWIIYLYASYTLFSISPFYTSNNVFENESLIIIMNIFGIILLLLLSRVIKLHKYINYLGQNSLVLFFIHVPFVYYIYQFLSRYIYLHDPYLDNSIIGIIYTFLISLSLYPIVVFLNRYKILVGKGRMMENFLLNRNNCHNDM